MKATLSKTNGIAASKNQAARTFRKGKERRRKSARFRDKNVVSAAGGAGVHRLKAQAAPIDLRPERRRWKGERRSSAEQEKLAAVPFVGIEEVQNVSLGARDVGEIPRIDVRRGDQERATVNDAAQLKRAAWCQRKRRSRKS